MQWYYVHYEKNWELFGAFTLLTWNPKFQCSSKFHHIFKILIFKTTYSDKTKDFCYNESVFSKNTQFQGMKKRPLEFSVRD